MTRLTDEELEELERLNEWASDDWTGTHDASSGVSVLSTGRVTMTSSESAARDDVFMAAAARNAIPSLLAEVRELREARVHECPHCPCEGLPTLDDVEREAVRVFGRAAYASDDIETRGSVRVMRGDGTPEMFGTDKPPVIVAPTIASAYAALRALPDWKGET